MTIRPATAADAPVLAELVTELGYPTTADEMAVRLDHILHHIDYQTIVAEQSDDLLGMIGLVRGLYWEQTGYLVRIIALVVSPLARGQGVADRLIEAAETWARVQGATNLALNCGNRPERAAAHRFYPRMGFVASSTGYRKTLRISPGPTSPARNATPKHDQHSTKLPGENVIISLSAAKNTG